MNFIFKKIVKRLNVLIFLRKVIAYLLIFSIFWQNSLWAIEKIYAIEEDLEGVRARTYNSRRIGVVEPGVIRNDEIHNVFADLQLLEEGGLVFKGTPNASTIYNRVYNADPIQLSGIIQADAPVPMVFANPGGIVLENPSFQNIHDLTLAAGTLAQTNEGMAYGVDQGSLSLNKTFIQEESDVKTLSLAGRGVRINQSFLCPSETLTVRTGQYVKGWNREGHWLSKDYMEPNTSPLLDQNSIFFDDSTILRSKGLFLESLEEGTSIHTKGLLQSTNDDIIIRAKGDVYVDKLLAHRNLKIKTTGKVYFGNQTFVGGAVKIKAAKIVNKGNITGAGKITFDAPLTKNKGSIKTQDILETKSFINRSTGRLEARSVSHPLALLSQNLGTVQLQDDLKLTVTEETFKGIIKTQGRFEVGGQNLTINGHITAQNGFLFNCLKKLTNQQNSTFSAFGSGVQGSLDLLVNEGKIDLSCSNATIKDSRNKRTGVIRTRGHSTLQGDHHLNEGSIFTGGVHQTTLTGTYKDSGTFYSPSLFLLKARDIEYVPGHKSFLKDGVLSASSRFSAGEKVSFELYGSNNPCFLQFGSQTDLRYNGSIRSFSSNTFPILDYFKIFNQTPVPYKDFEKEIALRFLKSWKGIRSSLGSGVTLQAVRDIDCKGATINPESGSVNLFANGTFNTSSAKIKAGYFRGDNAAIQSKRAVLNHTEVSSLLGTTSIIAQEIASLNNSTVQGSLLASVVSQDVSMSASTVTSTHGKAVVHGESTTAIKQSSVQAQSSVSIRGGDVEIDSTKLRSQHEGVCIEAIKPTRPGQTILAGPSVPSREERIVFSHSHLEGLYSLFKAAHIGIASSSLTGPTFFDANSTLQICDLEASGRVLAISPAIGFSGSTTADSLQAKAEVVQQFGSITTVTDSHIEASESYIDSATSSNEAGRNLSIDAQQTTGFKGFQKAGDTLEIKLKDMDLLAFLNQTEAPLTKAHLLEGEISFSEDFILNRTLHLWAKNLENKARFTATKDFLAHLQENILNEGSMIVQGKLGLEARATLTSFGLIEGGDVKAKAKAIILESRVHREAIPGGYRESLEAESIMRAREGNLTAEATDLLYARGAKFEAKLNIDLRSLGKLYLGAQQLTSDVSFSSKRSHYHRFTLNNHKSQVSAGENVDIWSGEGMVFQGLDVTAAGYIHAKSEGTLKTKAVHDIFQEEIRTQSGGGPFREKKTETIQTALGTLVRTTFKAGKDIRLESEGDNHQQAPRLESGEDVVITSHQGRVYLEAGKSTNSYSRASSSENAVWQSHQQQGHVHEKVEILEILSRGGIHISGAEGVDVEIKDSNGLMPSLDGLESYSETAWVKALRQDPKVTWHLISEEHKEWNHKSQGLSGPAAAVISLAIAIATQGTGASLIAGISTNATVGAMASAGFTSLVSQATISLINNQGDISKVLRDLGSKDSLCSLATSIASAGIVQGLSETFNLPQRATTFAEHLQKNVISSGTSAGLSILLQQQDVKEALLQAVKGAAAGTLGGMMANTIGEAYCPEDGSNPKIDPVMHKFLHAIAGAGMGAILGDDPGKGAIAGAIGAALAETIADFLSSNVEGMVKDLHSTAKAEGRSFSAAEAERELGKTLHHNADIARLSAATMALLTGQDVHTAISTSQNALDNNFIIAAVPWLIGTGMVAWSAYEIHDAYKTEGPQAALKQLGIEAVTWVGGVAAGKIGFKVAGKIYPSIQEAVNVLLSKNPTLKIMLGDLTEKLVQFGDKIASSATFQKVAKFDAKLDQLAEKLSAKPHVQQVSSTQSSEELVKWVDEKASMNSTARYYNDTASGARSNIYSKLSQAPALQYVDIHKKPCLVRFDGIERGILIDRKIAIVTTDKARKQALRQSEALKQNSLKGRWEVPNVSQQNRAEKMLKELKITNIEVKVVNVPNSH